LSPQFDPSARISTNLATTYLMPDPSLSLSGVSPSSLSYVSNVNDINMVIISDLLLELEDTNAVEAVREASISNGLSFVTFNNLLESNLYSGQISAIVDTDGKGTPGKVFLGSPVTGIT